jgi:hypothetical protein
MTILFRIREIIAGLATIRKIQNYRRYGTLETIQGIITIGKGKNETCRLSI